jgi:fructosamine-3-kinase
MWKEIATEITKNINHPFEISDRQSVGGGCINQAYKLISNDLTLFIKLNQASAVEMFTAEYLGLKEMFGTNTIRVPKPICYGIAGNNSYLVLEWLEIGRGKENSWFEMGQKLALLHKHKKASQFGWSRNNTIGSTPQINTWCDNWADFFAEHRIGYQLRLANRKGGNFTNPDKTIETVRQILSTIKPQPSLLHGDLWSGNADCSIDGEPVIFDPATYYGDRETDLAMTELFGGFPAAFYRGYNQEWQLDQEYQQRKIIYNLYHILNHFNLFGSSYASQAASMIRQIISF